LSSESDENELIDITTTTYKASVSLSRFFRSLLSITPQSLVHRMVQHAVILTSCVLLVTVMVLGSAEGGFRKREESSDNFKLIPARGII